MISYNVINPLWIILFNLAKDEFLMGTHFLMLFSRNLENIPIYFISLIYFNM